MVGFDMEWPVVYKAGDGTGRTAVVQVAVLQPAVCFVFHVCHAGIPPLLEQVRSSARGELQSCCGVTGLASAPLMELIS
jgi:hypothetical protein